jgi:hypothetical protein
MKKIRLGLLIDSAEIPAWAFEMLNLVINKHIAEFSFVIIASAETNRERISTGSFLYRRFMALENKMFKPVPDAFERKHVSALQLGTPDFLTATYKVAESNYLLPDDIIAKIRDYQPDVLIYPGEQPLAGKVLTVAKFGVWAYYHADNAVLRGGLPGFREVMKNKRDTGVILYIMSGERYNGKLLQRSWGGTDRISVNRNRNKNYWKSAAFLPAKLEELQASGGEQFMQRVEQENLPVPVYKARHYQYPANAEALALIFQHEYKWIKSKLVKTFYKNQWILLYAINNKRGFTLEGSGYKKMLPPDDRIWADPFIVKHDNKYLIFLEEAIHNQNDNKAHISVMEMDENGNYGEPVMIIRRPYHLSYPNVFKHEGLYYMIPESMENKTIEVYKALNFPYEWEFHMNLMEGVRAVDTTILQKDGKYWMFANMRRVEGASESDELFVFSSEDLLTTNWLPHKKNPVISDVKSARPAGNFFVQDNKLYRPSQDCSWRYGYATNINEVVKLDEEEYIERTVHTIKPGWQQSIVGTHTYNSCEGLSIIDAILQKRK